MTAPIPKDRAAEAGENILSRHPGESLRDYADRLELEGRRCLSGAAKEWPHHAEHSRRTGHELLATAERIREGLR